jgi:SRSO17 transposase
LERAVPQAGAPEALLIDDTGFPKQGTHSVGVARQYCGQLGKQDNCQVAVSVSLANEHYSLPVAYRLYLPKEWVADSARRTEAKIPETVAFATKPALALQLLATAVDGLPKVVVVDAGYGVEARFGEAHHPGFQLRGQITGAVSVWPEGQAPLPPKTWSGRGRKTKLLRRDAQHQPLSAKALALQLSPRRFHAVTWREGTNDTLSSRFAAVRVRCAHRTVRQPHPGNGCWSVARDEANHQILLEHLARRRAQGIGAVASCAGASSVTRNSNRNWASATSRAAAGAVFTTMRACASPPMASCSPNA